MNIFALEGHKVVCTTFDAGYEVDQRVAKKYLEIGKIYAVHYTEVSGWSTEVHLEGFPPDVSFNSVFFEDIEEQSEEDDEQHPDYQYYN